LSRLGNIRLAGGVNATRHAQAALHLFVHCAKGRKVLDSVPIRWNFGQIGAAPLRGNCATPDLPQKRSGSGDGQSERFSMSQSLSQLMLAYLPLIVFVGVAGVIGLVLLVVAFIVAYQQPDPEKLSAYECGFNAFDDARMKFDVRFYLVAILFIIFDLEVSFLFPWAVAFGKIGVYGFWSMMLFLGVLTIGFIYEWKKGALEWD
jgi:NADH-quinone oxidoreductase subunit A